MTRTVLLLALIILVLYDIWVIYYYGTNHSISRVIYYLSREHPVIAFAAGFLCGHIFWRND